MVGNDRKFYTVNGRRQILIAEDEEINRELLVMILSEEYDILTAADGEETLQLINENRDTLALVILDLYMPKRNGIEVLKEMKETPETHGIPVIVATSDHSSEVECLKLGANDFISKPYPNPGVILARAQRTIELHEDQETIQQTERDHLTGLYNRDYFYNYAVQFDQHHKDQEMDAIVIDVNHFHLLNERYGRSYADEVLKRISERAREMVNESDGIVCRREADTFLIYCPHGQDYEALLTHASHGLGGDEVGDGRVRLRMGVYECVDKSVDIEIRFDRAKMAADTVRNSFTKTIALYDSALHERELFQEQLVEEFPKAIEERQFAVYYQPKFNIQGETPILASAEALVRWKHPRLGMVNPGVFIPLFEENGLIQELDLYVWRETAKQIKHGTDQFGEALPVSINVSRIDMLDPNLPDILLDIVRENGITPQELMLEITESAYTQDSEQIIEMAERLRTEGFVIEMDDFGTGYSSLGMISQLPLDVLKLDMQFVRRAFQENSDTRMIEVVLDIANHLGVPVIAEGVESEEQMRVLRELGCNYAQGFYFSRAVPPEEFEPFLEQKIRILREKERNEAEILEKRRAGLSDSGEVKRRDEHEATVETRETAEAHGVSLRFVNILFAVFVFLLAGALFTIDALSNRGYTGSKDAGDNYISCKLASVSLEGASDYLTNRVRSFVVTGNSAYLDDYYEEITVTKRRDQALSDLENLMEGTDGTAYSRLSEALTYSNELMLREYAAIKLVLIANDMDIPEWLSGTEISEEDLMLGPDAMKVTAQQLVFDDVYMGYKDMIRDKVRECSDELVKAYGAAMEKASGRLSLLLGLQTSLTVMLLLLVLLFVLFLRSQVRSPLTTMVERIRDNESVQVRGAKELQFVSGTYNIMLKETQKTQRELTYEAFHDGLTGVYNRAAYQMFMDSMDLQNIALLIIDIDLFKQFNDLYGHDVGDRVLKKVASLLQHTFRSVDIICRYGGDEFVIIMTRVNSSMSGLVKNKIAHLNEILQHPDDGLPEASLSVGVAFSDRENPEGDIFKDADTALYWVKEAGRKDCRVYGEDGRNG